jgi:pimeloyl-ACP methyl ester carboxylesterase
MSHIFLIAGMGADTRIYNRIELGDNEVTPVDWIEPNDADTLSTYAQKLIYQYHIEKGSIVIGNSLGGTLAIEIAKLVPLQKVILISSIKTIDEAPGYFKVFKRFPVYKHLSDKILVPSEAVLEKVFGQMASDDRWLFKDMLKKTSPKFLRWAMKAALYWDNHTIPPNNYHITGDKDRVFNYKRIKDATIVKGGTHIMIFDKAKDINKLIKVILNKK